MQFEMTPQRVAYFSARGKVILNACPGSGKTTCIIHKLALLEKECLKNHGNHAGIVCLSFTNVAKNEILHKYKEVYGYDFRFPNLVSTIDSFINQYLTLPYYNLLNKNFKRPQIVDQAGIIDKLVSIKYRNKSGKIVDGIQAPMNKYYNRAGLPVFRSYAASKIWVDVDGNFTFHGKVPDPALVDPAVFQAYAKDLFHWKIRKGLITSLDSAYIALCILNKHEDIGRWLVKRFPYIIIDEAQDNSEIQHAIFDKLTDLGLINIELIGDPYQSLYEWRDAKPQLFIKKYADASWTGLPLSQNRRSVQRIIDCFSILRNPADELITTVDVIDLNIPVIIYRYTTTNPALIVSDFELKCASNKFIKNHIVVRGNTLKNRMLGNTSDIEPWKYYCPYLLLKIKHHFETNEIKGGVNELRKLVLDLLNPDLDYHAMQKLQIEMADNFAFNGKLYSFLFKIPPTDLSLQVWTNQSIQIIDTHFGVDATPAFEFKMRINDYKMVDLKKKAVNLFFNKPASNQHNIPVTTIHQIKGATLDAILYFFDERRSGESVSFEDFKQSVIFPTEKQRMIYVACSRPKQLLALAFPDRITAKQITDKFGDKVDIICL
jgi:superfamily I DNA/RNA helicase